MGVWFSAWVICLCTTCLGWEARVKRAGGGGHQWRQLNTSEALIQNFPLSPALLYPSSTSPLPSSSLCLWRMIIHWMRGVTAWQGRASSAVITIAGHRQSTASWQLKTTTDVKGTFQRHTQRCCPLGFNRNLTQTHTQTRRLSLKVRARALTPNQQFQWRMGTPCSGGKHTAYSS